MADRDLESVRLWKKTQEEKEEVTVSLPEALSMQVPDRRQREATAEVFVKGLLRKVETQDGTRYEITDTGWRFLKEYQEIQHELSGRYPFPIENRGSVWQYSGSAESHLQTPEMLEFLSDPRRAREQYEALRPDISIAIPTLNEAGSLGWVLGEVPKHLEYRPEVLVIDASDDDTPLVAAKFGAKVLRQRGQGKGDALRQAFCVLGSDIIVMMDGDASMRPEEIPRFVETIISGADVVKGSRFLRHGYSEDLSFIRKIGNLLFVSLVNLLWSAEYTDLCYGFMAFKRSALERLKPHLKSKGFQIETEICIRAKKLGMKVVEVPSVELPRIHGRSKLNGIHDSLRIFRTILRECLPPF